MDAVQPQHLAVAGLLGQVAGPEGGGVIAARLGHAHAPLDGADVVFLHINLHRVEPLGVVGPHGAHHHDVLHMVGGVDAQGGVQPDHKGADIQGGVLLIGHPVLLHLHQLGDAGQGDLLGDLGQADSSGGVVHPGDVVPGPEQLNGAVGGAVGLQPLKNLLAVVEHFGGGVDLQGAVGDDTGVMPALASIVVHNEHMVGHGFAENQGGGVRLLLQGGGTGDFNFHL